MTREDLLRALGHDDPAQRACHHALLDGAELVVWEDGVPASILERIYARRENHARSMGQPTIGLAEAVVRLRECGSDLVRLGKVTAKDRLSVFMLFIALDRPRVIACTGVDQSRLSE